MRSEHDFEVNALYPIGGKNAVLLAYDLSDVCLAARRGGATLCIFGVSCKSVLTQTGAVWLLGTSAMDRNGLWIAKHSKQMLLALHLLSGSKRLENLIPASYLTALRWLKWMGFTISETREKSQLTGIEHVRVWHEKDRHEQPA